MTDPRTLALIFENVSWNAGGSPSTENAVPLADISFTAEYGEFVVVTGGRGAGKTLLLEIAAGWRMPSSGRAIVLGRDPSGCRRARLAELRRSIGFAPQEPRFIEGRSVLEHVAIPLLLGGVATRPARDRAEECLLLLGLEEMWERPASDLSHDEKRRLAYACAVARDPSLVVVDEPQFDRQGGNLDPLAHLEKLSETGKTIILATSDRGIARGLGGANLHLEKGRVAERREKGEGGRE